MTRPGLALAVATMQQRAQAAWDRWELDQREHRMLLEPGDLEGELPPGWGWDQKTDTPVRMLPWYKRLGVTGRVTEGRYQERSVELGLHPCGARLHPRALHRQRTKCGDCRFRATSANSAHYCVRGVDNPHSFQAIWRYGQRIRLKWGACEHWVQTGKRVTVAPAGGAVPPGRQRRAADAGRGRAEAGAGS